MRAAKRNLVPTWTLLRSEDVGCRLVDVDADEIQGSGDDLQVLDAELGSVSAGRLQVCVRVFAFEHHRQKGRVELSRAHRSGLDVLGTLDQRDGTLDHLCGSYLGAGLGSRAHGLNSHAVREHGVVTDLIQLPQTEPQSRRDGDGEGAVRYLDVDASMAAVNE